MPLSARSAWSCEQCRRRKVRCDRRDPCDRCQQRGELCKWPPNAAPSLPDGAASQNPHRPTGSQDVHSRLARIERILLQAGLTESGDNSQASSPNPALTSVGRETSVDIHDLVEPTSRGALQTDIQLHDGFDHSILGVAVPSTPGQADNVPNGMHRRTVGHIRRLLQQKLPGRPECDDLLATYLRYVEWIHHPLHVPTFKKEYMSFWQRHDRGEERYTTLDMQWMALLFIVLCLGNHFDQSKSSITIEEELYSASSELLFYSDYLSEHSMTVIQTLILMGLWLNNRGLGNKHHAQLSVAIKMAIGLGFSKMDAGYKLNHQDDAVFFSLSHNLPRSPTDLTVQKELQRRIWFSLVCQDYYTASSCNFTYNIHPGQSKTWLFQNLDDEDLGNSAVPTSHVALSIYEFATASTYHLIKIPFTRIAKAMVDLYNDDSMTYEAVLDLERLLWRIYNDTPVYFQWTAQTEDHVDFPKSPHVSEEHLGWQRLFIGFTVHNRIMRLHRPFMARAYTEPGMGHSRDATLDSALACLKLGEHGHAINFPGLRWWVILVHIYTAGIVFCIELHSVFTGRVKHDQHSSEHVKTRLRSQVMRIMDLLRPASITSVAAARATKILQGLLEQAGRRSKRRVDHAMDGRPAKRSHTNGGSQAALSDYSATSPGVATNGTSPGEDLNWPFMQELLEVDLFSFDDWTTSGWDFTLNQ